MLTLHHSEVYGCGPVPSDPTHVQGTESGTVPCVEGTLNARVCERSEEIFSPI